MSIPTEDMNIIDVCYDEFTYLRETFPTGKSFELAVHKAILAERERWIGPVTKLVEEVDCLEWLHEEGVDALKDVDALLGDHP